MRTLLLASLLMTAPAAASAQAAPQVVEVRLSSFDFEPATIRLHAGQPVLLRLTNVSSGGHNFAAPQFFGAARITGGQSELHNGAIEVPSHQSREIRLVPAPGSYRLRCTHTLHSTFGMRGRIVVE